MACICRGCVISRRSRAHGRLPRRPPQWRRRQGGRRFRGNGGRRPRTRRRPDNTHLVSRGVALNRREGRKRPVDCGEPAVDSVVPCRAAPRRTSVSTVLAGAAGAGARPCEETPGRRSVAGEILKVWKVSVAPEDYQGRCSLVVHCVVPGIRLFCIQYQVSV